MALPEWVKEHKRVGHEIKEIRGNYYMYRIKSAWDPARKKARKVTGEYIGKVTPEGVVPKRERIDRDAPVLSLEYGATALLAGLCGDLLDALREHFERGVADRVWAMAMLRLISPSPFSRMGMRHAASWAREALPGLALSPASVSGLIDAVGNDRAACAAFMRATSAPSPYYLIDGTRCVSRSEGIARAELGHAKANRGLAQLNQVYIVGTGGGGGCVPAFYRNAAGNVPDVTALELTLKDAQVTGAVLIGDTGFASGDNFDLIAEAGLGYIVPLRRSTAEVDLAAVAYEDVFTYHRRAIWAHSEARDGYRICVFRDERLRAEEAADFVSRAEKANATKASKRSFDPERDALRDVAGEAAESACGFGVIVMRTSLMEATLQDVYSAYKSRWETGQLFDTLRSPCDGDASYMHDDAGFEAWSFVGHLTLLAACRVLALLRSRGLSGKWSLTGVMDCLSRVHAVRIGDSWRVAEVVGKTRELAEELGLDLSGKEGLLPKL